MAGEEFSREELLAFTQSNKEQAVALNQVLELIETNSGKLDEVLKKLNNGLKSDIVDSIVGRGDEKTSLNAIKKDTSETRSDVKMSKYFIGAVVIISVIASVIVNSIVKSSEIKKYIQQEFVNAGLESDTVEEGHK